MPVVVVGTETPLARALVPLLRERGSEVRAYVRPGEPAEALRALGAKVASGDPGDAETLALVMRDAHTVCHLAGGLPFDDPPREHEAGEGLGAALEAAAEAGIRRFLLLSSVGASTHAPNPYLRERARAERAVAEAGIEHVILRCTHVYGPQSGWLRLMLGAARGPVAAVVGPGTQRLAPVFVEDVAACLAAADDRAAGASGTFALQGPDQVSADELVDLLAGRRRRKVHLPPRRAAAARLLLGASPPPSALALLAADSLADGRRAEAEFGLALTPLREGLARSGVPAAGA